MPIFDGLRIADFLIAQTITGRHNECDGVSNYQPYDCLLNRFIQAQINENIKAPRHEPLCGEFTGNL